jgi:hypothetical protein
MPNVGVDLNHGCRNFYHIPPRRASRLRPRRPHRRTGVPAIAQTMAPNADAELIRQCERIEDNQRRFGDLYQIRTSMEAERRTEHD